jgi:hypothetical protein
MERDFMGLKIESATFMGFELSLARYIMGFKLSLARFGMVIYVKLQWHTFVAWIPWIRSQLSQSKSIIEQSSHHVIH